MDAASEIPPGPEDRPVAGERGETEPQAPSPPSEGLVAWLAGLQAGMIGILIMLFWLGISSVWQGRSFWRSENLMASAFYRAGSIRPGLSGRSLSGLALYLVVYSLLGALTALLLRNRLARVRTLLVCIAVAMLWYYLSFRWMWRTLAPPLAFLHAERPMILGHMIYGLWLGRYPEYMQRGQGSGIRDQGAQPSGVEESANKNSDASQIREP
jgi:hypothetical protein